MDSLLPENSGSDEEEWEEARESDNEGEEEEIRVFEYWEAWPFFSREAVCPEREWARRSRVQVLRCQEHKAWYLWHPPRPGGCALCPGGCGEGTKAYPQEYMKKSVEIKGTIDVINGQINLVVRDS